MAELDLLSRILLGLVLTAGLAFLLLLSWKFPRQVFLAVFLFRPLLEMARLISGKQALVQKVINGAGVGVPVVFFLVLLLHRKAWSADDWLPWAFVAVVLASAAFHERDRETGEMLIRILTPVIFLMFPRLVMKSEKDLRTFLRVVGGSAVFVLIALYLDRGRTNINPLYGWVQDAIPLVGGERQNRLGAVFGVPTMTAYWVFLFFAVSYFLSETERFGRRFLHLAVWIILLVPIYLTFTRAAWLGCLIVVFLYSLLKGRAWKRISLVLGLTAVAVIALPNILHRLQNPATIGYRFAVWAGYIRSVMARGGPAWLTGMGLANLPEKNVYSGHLYSPGATGLVENSFVFLLAGAGLAAAVIFILLAANLARRAWWLRRNGATPFVRDFGSWGLALLVVWLLMGMVGDMVTYVVVNWYWYAFFGCLIAAWENEKESARIQGEPGPPPEVGTS